jgi:hypothetical protein
VCRCVYLRGGGGGCKNKDKQIGLFWLHYSGFQALGGIYREGGDLIGLLLFFKIREVG